MKDKFKNIGGQKKEQPQIYHDYVENVNKGGSFQQDADQPIEPIDAIFIEKDIVGVSIEEVVGLGAVPEESPSKEVSPKSLTDDQNNYSRVVKPFDDKFNPMI